MEKLGPDGAAARSRVLPASGARAMCALLFLVFLGASSPACGYRFDGTAGKIPEGIRSIAVGEFRNASPQSDLDERLVFALERELHRRGVFDLAVAPQRGDGRISGAIGRYRTRPVAFDEDDEALQYEIEVTVEADLRRTADGQIVWQGRRVYAIDEYSAKPDTVVPSSSRFQRGRVEFATLDDLTAIQLAETERDLALQRLVDSIVRDLHDRILDDF